MSRKLVWTVALGLVGLTLILGGYFGLTRWRAHVQRQRDLRNLTEARRALEAGSVSEARRLHGDSRELGFPNAHLQQDWKRLELDLALNDSDPLRLLSIYQSDRALVEGNERASLSIVAALRQLGRREEDRAARERWRGKETRKDASTPRRWWTGGVNRRRGSFSSRSVFRGIPRGFASSVWRAC